MDNFSEERLKEKKKYSRERGDNQRETNEGGKRDYPAPRREGKDGREEWRDDERRDTGGLG